MKDLSSALLYKTSYLTIEVIGFKQLFEGEVHTIAPIVVRVGRDVDTLGIGVRKSQTLIYGEPILQGQYCKHRP